MSIDNYFYFYNRAQGRFQALPNPSIKFLFRYRKCKELLVSKKNKLMLKKMLWIFFDNYL
jgi:hypothetical protein